MAENGVNGVGPGVVFRGNWSKDETYYGTTRRCDVVKRGTQYYIANVTAQGYFSGEATDPSIDDTHWSPFGESFSSVATGLLFAEMAYVDNLSVKYYQGAIEQKVAGTVQRFKMEVLALMLKLI